jgi:probable O-glycosylation ligase (exosortase A-associated)
MREAILTAVVCGLAAIALVRPRIGLYSYIWFALMRPDYFAWALGSFPFSPVLAIATLVGSLQYYYRYPVVLQQSLSRALILYQLPVIASVFLAVDPALSYDPFWEFERIVLMALLIPVLIESVEHLRTLFLVIVFSLGAIGLKFGIFGWRMGGTSISDGYAGLDNNALAVALVIALPFCWYMRSQVQSRWVKALMLAVMFGCVATVIMTKSRGASLAMATTFLLMTIRSRRKVAVAILVVLLAAPSIYLVREQYIARMSTLEDPTADSSANSRIILAEAYLEMWKDYPVFGVGFGNENGIRLLPHYLSNAKYAQLKIHNTYLQVLVDSGIFAFLIFVYLLFGAIIRLYSSMKVCRAEGSGLEIYPAALQTALIAVAQYGITGGRERYDCLYFLLMAAAAWFLIQRESRVVPETEAAAPVLAEA